jgi:uncharacterized hydrophobic protein (TIGR00271 family)
MATDSIASALPITWRRSKQLRPVWARMLNAGLWMIVGIFVLYDKVQALSRGRTGLAYILIGIVMIPTALCYAQLRSWIGRVGGSHRLIQAVERPRLTFFSGWNYILGWAALSALLAQSFAFYAGNLLQAAADALQVTLPAINPLLFILTILLLFTITNILGQRPAWRLTMWLVGLAMLSMALLALLLLALKTDTGAVFAAGQRPGTPFGGIALLAAAMWVTEMTADMQSGRGVVRSSLVTIFGGPVLAASFTIIARAALPSATNLESMATAILPVYGPLALWGLGLLATGVAWQVLALLTLRQLQIIGGDGWLPEALLRLNPRFNTPILLVIVQSLLTLLALALSNVVDAAEGAALTFLLMGVGVNLAQIMLGRSENGDFNLPLYPAIPASGAAINVLLLTALSLPTLALGGAWFALGGLVYFQVARSRMRTSQLGVTVFQDTRRPDITSRYPVVIPVANPDTAASLVNFGAAVARHYGGHVVLVQVVVVPEQVALDSRSYQARTKHNLLERLLQDTEKLGVEVEGVTRLSRSVAQGIVDTVQEETAELVVMGWKARQGDGDDGRIGHIVDEVLEHAPSDVAVITGDWPESLDSILVPISGGPHAPRGAELALAITAQTNGTVTLANVARSAADEAKSYALLQAERAGLSEAHRIETFVIRARNVFQGLLDASQDYDALLLGASEQTFLDEQPFGQLPVQLAQHLDIPLVLVRGYTGLPGFVARQAWQSLSDLLPQLGGEEQLDLFQRMRAASRPSINYFVLIALSALIATLGLLLNSPAVIIGAMLVAPLMSPIVAAATGIVFGDERILSDTVTATVQGVLLAIFLAMIATLISPLAGATNEILSRTRPNLLDLGVAIFSGMAGAYAIAREEVGAALPGVAIAAALMPPVCAVGIGLALGNVSIAGGALLLFVANLSGIIVSSSVVFLLLGVRPPRRLERQQRLRRGLISSIISLLLVSIPLALFLASAVRQGAVESQVLNTVRQTVANWGDVELVDSEVVQNLREVTISGTLYTTQPITNADMQSLQSDLESEINRSVKVELFVVQGSRLGAESTPTDGGGTGGEGATPAPVPTPTPTSISIPTPTP